MERTDTPSRGSVETAWTALTHRAAAVVGALTGLVSLLSDVPVANASLRGGLAWIAVSILGRATSWLLARTVVEDANVAPKPPETS